MARDALAPLNIPSLWHIKAYFGKTETHFTCGRKKREKERERQKEERVREKERKRKREKES